MKLFVNRTAELKLIDEAVTTLIERQRLLRTPIIEFYGVQGIGKSMLLQNIQQRYTSKQLSFVWADLAQEPDAKFVQDTRELLEHHQPVIMILDSLDTTNPALLREIEKELSALIEHSLLFVVLASRSEQKFSRARSIARKLTLHPLQPLERASCDEYLNAVQPIITAQVREVIFEWTGGYPLAMNVMTDAIVAGQLNPANEQDQQSLITILTEKVIQQKLLSAVISSERERYQTLLSLLSVPRRFNLALMQDLIEAYAPSYKLASSIAYITLPSTFEKAVSVLRWDMVRSGYGMDAPVRKLCLLKLKIEQPQLFSAVHRFLVEKNKTFAQEVSGSDRIHYLRECLYHLSCCERGDTLRTLVTEHIKQMVLSESSENFLRFYEEFRQDGDLQDTLEQDGTELVLSLLLKNFIMMYTNIPRQLRSQFLQEVFLSSENDPQMGNFSLIFEDEMSQIILQESSDEVRKLYHELVQDEVLKTLLGQEFDAILARIFHTGLEEGE